MTQGIRLDVHGLGAVGLFGVDGTMDTGQGREQEDREEAAIFHRARILQSL
ncbi:hypothetical protein D3C71_2206670 [compost metagenome]